MRLILSGAIQKCQKSWNRVQLGSDSHKYFLLPFSRYTSNDLTTLPFSQTYVASKHNSPALQLLVAHLGELSKLLSLLGSTCVCAPVEYVLLASVGVDQKLFVFNGRIDLLLRFQKCREGISKNIQNVESKPDA